MTSPMRIANVLAASTTLCLAAAAPTQTLPKLSGKLTIDQALRAAVDHNPSLTGAFADVTGAEAVYRAARTRVWPRLNFNSFAFTGNNSVIASSSPGVDPTSLMAIPPAGFADQNLMLMIPIYTAGILTNSIRSARAGVRVAGAGEQMLAADIELAVRDAYLRVLVAREFVKAEETRVKSTREMERVSREQFEAGKGIEATVSRAQAETADAQRALTSARNDVDKALLDLKAAMGIDLDSEIDPSDPLSYSEPSVSLNDAVRTSLKRRGDVLGARWKLRQAEFQRRITDANGSPQIYGVAMADAMSAKDMSSSGGAALGITLSIPLFDAGERRADREQASSSVRRAQADEAQAELSAQRDVREAWLDVETAAQNYSTSQSALQAAQSAYDVITLRVESGKGILVEQLDALQSLVRAMANRDQALYDHAIALARLDRAEGLTPTDFGKTAMGGTK